MQPWWQEAPILDCEFAMMKFAILPAFALLLVLPAYAQETAAPLARVAPAAVDENAHFGWADVLRVDPVYESASTNPQQPCYEEQVPVDPPEADNASARHGVATMVGALVGGLFGNQFGKGSGRAAATVAGAVAGGAIGGSMAASDDTDSRPRYTTRRHCPPAAPRKVVAYDVEYRYRGDVYTSRLAYDPGDRLRVRVRVTPAE
jgi:uncharacterized protein YcfJ